MFLNEKKEEEERGKTKISVSNSQLRLQPPPQVAHASRWDQQNDLEDPLYHKLKLLLSVSIMAMEPC